MTVYAAAFTLFLVMDPMGNVPLFMSMLKSFSPKKRNQILLRESIIAFFVLALFLFFGGYILSGLSITTEALSISGGIILFIIALKMIFPPDRDDEKKIVEEPFIVPMAIPLIAGPSSLATVLLFTTRDPDHTLKWLTAVFIAATLSGIVLLSSNLLMKILGKRLLIAIERLMGMILTTLATQMLLSGIAGYFKLGIYTQAT